MQMQTQPKMNGFGTHKTKAGGKSILITDLGSTTDDDGREVITLKVEDQDGKRFSYDMPFVGCTNQRLQEVTKVLLNRVLIQQRAELELRSKEPVATFEQLWPYDCFMMLLKGFNQRSVRLDRAEMYAFEIKKKNWEYTCQGPGFDLNGVLINGQHTLWGCLLANEPIDTLVVRGLKPSAKEKIDRGAARSNACLLELDPGDLELSKLPPVNVMNAVMFRVYMLSASAYKNVWAGNKDYLAHMIRKYKRAMVWLKKSNYFAAKGVSRDFTKAPILAGFVLSYMLFPEETEKVASVVYHGSLADREKTPAIRSIYEYLCAGNNNPRAHVRVDSVLHQTYRILRGLRSFIEKEKLEDVVTRGFPKTTEGREELLAFFSPSGDKHKLLSTEIDLAAYDNMMSSHTARISAYLDKAMAEAPKFDAAKKTPKKTTTKKTAKRGGK